MPRVESTVEVEAPIAVAFALSQTYGELRYRWDPFVREQHLLDGATAAGRGVRTSTTSRHRLHMVSEYVSFKPPTQVGMRMVEGPWFFERMSGGWSFSELSPTRTLAPGATRSLVHRDRCDAIQPAVGAPVTEAV